MKPGNKKGYWSGIKNPKYRHGLSRDPRYGVWRDMINRCYNPKSKAYKHYGGRGIQVCIRWHNPRNFLVDMGERPPKAWLERLKNNRNYNPKNCVWASPKIQAVNKRSNVFILHRGFRKTISQWSVETGIHFNTIKYRLMAGWSPEMILGSANYRGQHKTKEIKNALR